MAIVPITTGTAIANSTTIEATVIITIDTMGTGGIAGIIMVMAIITIIAAIITITIDAKDGVPRSRLVPGAKGPWVSIFVVCSCWFVVALRL